MVSVSVLVYRLVVSLVGADIRMAPALAVAVAECFVAAAQEHMVQAAGAFE
jgi:hypothetical protein